MTFDVVELSLATTDRLYQYKQAYSDIEGFGIKAFDQGWVRGARSWEAGEKILDVGGAYSPLPRVIQEQFGCEVWVADDFGIESRQEFWLRNRSPQEYITAHPELKFVLERVGDPQRSSLPENYFDVVYSISVLEHVPKKMAGDVWKHMARLVRPGGELIHAIDILLPVNGGISRVLQAMILDILSPLLSLKRRQAYLMATPKNYVSFVLSVLKVPAPGVDWKELSVLRTVIDSEVLNESYEIGLNRILKDNPHYQYQRTASLLIHLRS